jgi:hypothetical protein
MTRASRKERESAAFKKLKQSKRFKRSLCKEADTIVNADRPDRYGDVGESFTKASILATQMMTKTELAGDVITAQMVVKIMKAIKITRDTYSPDNPDHMRDECGYTELLDQLRQLGIK